MHCGAGGGGGGGGGGWGGGGGGKICEVGLMIHPTVSFDANANICSAIFIKFPVNM